LYKSITERVSGYAISLDNHTDHFSLPGKYLKKFILCDLSALEREFVVSGGILR
jgi:hypothetical protein